MMMLVSNGSEDKATGIYSGLIGRAWWQLLPAVIQLWYLTLAVVIKAPLPLHTNTIKNFKNYLTVDYLLFNSYVVVHDIL